ncbi:MAG: hypothetical protein FWE09_00570 [Treponema sp.]|nr:hypothetical protein [Treponema sp.]
MKDRERRSPRLDARNAGSSRQVNGEKAIAGSDSAIAQAPKPYTPADEFECMQELRQAGIFGPRLLLFLRSNLPIFPYY